MSCRLRHCTVCWLRRQLVGVGALALGVYWWAGDETTRETCAIFAVVAVIFLLVSRHED